MFLTIEGDSVEYYTMGWGKIYSSTIQLPHIAETTKYGKFSVGVSINMGKEDLSEGGGEKGETPTELIKTPPFYFCTSLIWCMYVVFLCFQCTIIVLSHGRVKSSDLGRTYTNLGN